MCYHLHHHQSLNREGRWGTTDDFATSFLRFSLFSTALRDLPNSRPVLSLMLSSHLFLWQRKRWECVMGSLILRLLSATVTLSLRSQSPTCEKWGRKGEGVRYASFWGKWGLPSDITQLIQKSCYQRESLCQDPAGSRTTRKTSWPASRDPNWFGMDVSPVHRFWPKPSCKAQWKGEGDKADRKRGGKTTQRNGQAWSLPSPWGWWRAEKNGGNWLWSHLCCSNDPRS